MSSAIQQALARIRNARSVDEGDLASDELAEAARQNPAEVIALYRADGEDAFALVWSLQGLLDEPVLALFRDALRHKDSQVRWAAIEGLKHCASPALIPDFVAALKDRSEFVKPVAVEWLAVHGDARAIAPLEHLVSLPSQRKHSPGTVKSAEAALRRLRDKAL